MTDLTRSAVAFPVLVMMLCVTGALTRPMPLGAQPNTPATRSDALPRVSRAVGYYDDVLERVVLIGNDGPMRAGQRLRVWSWTGHRWELVTDAGPRNRGNAAGAYDEARRQGVVTGGASRAADDTTYEILAHTERATPGGWGLLTGTDLSPRDHHAMAFDRRSQTLLLFGGIGADRASPWPTDTWAMSPGGWVRVAEDGPSHRGRTAMVYDAKRATIVLFGGVGAPPAPRAPQPFRGDTWSWANGGWRKLAETGPSARYAHGMAFNERAGVVLLYGGASGFREGDNLADLWQWDGERWSEIAQAGVNPGPRYQPVMVYDRKRGRTVLFGGLNGKDDATWEWDGARWHRIVPAH